MEPKRKSRRILLVRTSGKPNFNDMVSSLILTAKKILVVLVLQTFYHRRIRDRDCYIGEAIEQPKAVVRNCTCTASDFECEFNYYRNDAGRCVLVDGATPLSISTEEEQCDGSSQYWYDRTNMRRIPYSSCEGGDRPDRGKRHSCANAILGGGHGFFWWMFIIVIPFVMAGAAAYWFFVQRSQG